MLWVLNLADGKHSLLDIAERSGMDFELLQSVAVVLARAGLLVEQPADTPTTPPGWCVGRTWIPVTSAVRGSCSAPMCGRHALPTSDDAMAMRVRQCCFAKPASTKLAWCARLVSQAIGGSPSWRWPGHFAEVHHRKEGAL